VCEEPAERQFDRPGFNTQHVIAATLDPASLGYSEAQVRAFYEQLSQHIRALPGVTAASFVNHLPLGPAREQTAVTDVMSPGPNKKDAVPIDVLPALPPAIFRRWVFRCCAAATLLFPRAKKGAV